MFCVAANYHSKYVDFNEQGMAPYFCKIFVE